MDQIDVDEREPCDIPLDVALDFVNTLEHSHGHDTEHLPDVESLVTWLADHAILDRAEAAGTAAHLGRSPAESDRALVDARALRRSLRAVIDARVAGRVPDAVEIEDVNRWLRRRAPLRLVGGRDGLSLRTDAAGDPMGAALGRLAEAAARGIVDDDPRRLRVCANDECRWVYYDTSRGGRRKWCDMAVCGNRAKARRHRERASAGQPGV